MELTLANILNNESLLNTYAFHAGVLVVKMSSMSVLTMFNRVKNKVSPNPEDEPLHGSKFKLTTNNSSVERVRRAHQNDVENIPPFLMVSFLYLLTGPSASTFSWLLRTFTAARVAYSLSYVWPAQPVRTLSYVTGLSVTMYMSYKVLSYFSSYW